MYNPSRWNRMYSRIRKVMNGANRKRRKRNASCSLNRKLYRAKANEGGTPDRNDRATAPHETMMLFRKKSGKPGRADAYSPRCWPMKMAR